MSSMLRTARILALTCGLLTIAHTALGKIDPVSIHAQTAEQIIDAMLAARTSGRPTVIKVAPGHYYLSQAFESEFGGSTLPPVSATISIVGKDAATTIFDSGGQPLRTFTVLKQGNLRVQGVTITGGVAFCTTDCERTGGGAAINVGGLLRFDDCVLSGNGSSSETGAGRALGGALLNVEGQLRLERTFVVNNVAVGNGAGIAITGGTGIIRHSIISGNNTREGLGEAGETFGGGLYVSRASLTVSTTTVSGNMATSSMQDPDWGGFGGGIYNDGGSITLKRSAVTENVARSFGSGGGVFNGGKMAIEDSTVGGNSAGTLGGGIFNQGSLRLQGVTVSRNEVLGAVKRGGLGGGAGYPPGCDIDAQNLCLSSGGGIWNEPFASVRFGNSAIANNLASSSESDCYGVLISESHNALGTDVQCKLKPSYALHGAPTHDQLNLDVRIGELQDNGEPGAAHFPLLAHSPLIDAGGRSCTSCSAQDQLGNRRVDGDGDRKIECDVGAVEFQAGK